jgi:hypothetical protein
MATAARARRRRVGVSADAARVIVDRALRWWRPVLGKTRRIHFIGLAASA